MAGEVRAGERSRPPRILPLSHDIATNIVATSIIPDLKAVIVGLLQNSLDAKADNVAITIDPPRGYCKIIDSGRGISQQSFAPAGGLGQLNSTSEYLGSREAHLSTRSGRFLSSLAQISLLDITSRTSTDHAPSRLVLHQGVIIERLLNAEDDQCLNLASASNGTEVIVKDLFGNLPVRVKQRAIDQESAGSSERVWQAMVHVIVSILLAWPAACRVTLREKTTKLHSVTLFAEHPRTSRALTTSALRGDGSHSTSLTCTMIQKLGIPYQAKLCPTRHRADWVPVLASTSKIEVKGYICLHPSPHTTCQFISLQGCPVDKLGTDAAFYDIVNRVFARSSFGAQDPEITAHGHNIGHRTEESLRKSVDRHPMYIFAVSMRKSQHQTSQDIPSAEIAQSLLISATEQWLTVNNYSVRRRKVSARDPANPISPCMPKTQVSTGTAHLGSMPEIMKPAERGKVRQPAQTVPWTRIRSSRKIVIEDIQPLSEAELAELNAKHNEHQISPVRGDSRDSLRLRQLSGTVECTSLDGSSVPPISSILPEGDPPLPMRIKEWQAGLFDDHAAHGIPVCVPIVEEVESSKFRHALDDRAFLQEQVTNEHILSREDLKQATVIKQVDMKFILCKVQRRDANNPLLFIIDQHAASERVILERLLLDFTQPIERAEQQAQNQMNPPLIRSVILAKHIIFETTSQEHAAFVRRATDFATWGIVYDTFVFGEPLIPSHQPKEYRIAVRALPPVIAERCRLAPRILIDLLRSEVWEMVVPPTSDVAISNIPPTQPAWLTRLNRCPKRILDMINSRACRSAIMFNDMLSREECIKLVSDLAETVFPMMCAHGRTSVVPLFEMGRMPDVSSRWNRGYVDAYRTWKQ